MMMNVVYVLDTEKKNKEGEKEFYYKVVFHYAMN